MADMGRDRVEEGACYALAHSAYLIEDAAIIYQAGRIASSFHLAVMAREELGRANLLWKRASAMGSQDTIEAESLAKHLRNHKVKLDAGQSTTYFSIPPEMMAAWTAAIAKNDKTTLDAIHIKQRQIVEKVRKHDPAALHTRRLKAQYVHLNADGTWSRSSETSSEEAHALILTVAPEIFGSLLAAEQDQRFRDICARAQQRLPAFAEFQAEVMARVIPQSA